MTHIRVTPEELIRAAQQMADIGARISQVAGELNKALGELNPTLYQGQLFQKVAQKVWGGQAVVQTPVTRLGQLGLDLIERAKAFIAADIGFQKSRLTNTESTGQARSKISATFTSSTSAYSLESWCRP